MMPISTESLSLIWKILSITEIPKEQIKNSANNFIQDFISFLYKPMFLNQVHPGTLMHSQKFPDAT